MSDMQMIFGNPCERVIQLRTTDLNYRDLGPCGCKIVVVAREEEASIRAHSTPEGPQIWPCCFPPPLPHLQGGSISSTRSIRKPQWEQSSPSISARLLEQVLQPCLPFHALQRGWLSGLYLEWGVASCLALANERADVAHVGSQSVTQGSLVSFSSTTEATVEQRPGWHGARRAVLTLRTSAGSH